MRTASHTCSVFDGLVEEAGENSFCRCVETWKTSAALFQAGFFYTGSIFKARTFAKTCGFFHSRRSLGAGTADRHRSLQEIIEVESIRAAACYRVPDSSPSCKQPGT